MGVEKNIDIKTRLAIAKARLVLNHPFVGTIALNLPYEFDESIPTAATNGKRIKFNPKYIEKLDDEELMFLVAHECMHPMLEHNYRRQGRSPQKWNAATDYVINKLLTDEGIGYMPVGGLLSNDIYNAGGGTSEGIYEILPDEQDGKGKGKGRGKGKDEAGPLDDCEDAEGTPAEIQQQIAEWKVRVAQAAQAAKMAGKMSANMQRLVDEVLQPKVDWRDVLYQFVVRAKNDTRTFARFNRRFLPQGLYLPSISGEVMGEIVVAIDCSGSIDNRTLNQFAAEITKIKDDLQPVKIHVLYFDSSVTHVESYEPYDTLNLRPRGGGGTDYAPVFEKITKLGIEPVAIVFLTDLYCDSFGNQPDAPVLWVTTASRSNVPFGEVVEMK